MPGNNNIAIISRNSRLRSYIWLLWLVWMDVSNTHVRDSSDWRGIQNYFFWEKIQAKFEVFAADEEAPVCLCGRINFGSVLRRGTTLRGASALTDFEHTALLFVKNLHILGTSNTQKSVIRGSNLVSKQLRMKEGLPCPGQVLGVGLDRYQGRKVNLHF